MNRQQNRAKERQQVKDLLKVSKEIKRNAKTPMQEKIGSMGEWIATMPKEQAEYLNILLSKSSEADLNVLDSAYEIAIDSYFSDKCDFSDKDMSKIRKIIMQEGEYVNKYYQKGEDYMSKIEELKPQIKNRYKELKGEGKADKEIMNTLTVEFSQISTNAVKRAVNEYKRSKITDKDIEKAVESIFEEPKSDEVIEKENKPSQSILSEEKVKTTSKSLKVKSLIVEDEEGTEYIKENNTVTVGTMTFENEKDVEDFRNKSLKEYNEGCNNALAERKKQYEEEIAEINRAYEEEKIKFLKKVNNILDVMSM